MHVRLKLGECSEAAPVLEGRVAGRARTSLHRRRHPRTSPSGSSHTLRAGLLPTGLQAPYLPRRKKEPAVGGRDIGGLADKGSYSRARSSTPPWVQTARRTGQQPALLGGREVTSQRGN